MTLKTQIRNNTASTRNLRWAGVKGVSIGPLETIILDGAYPTACRNAACVSQFQHELENKLIEVILITDLLTLKPEEKKVEVKLATPVKVEIKEEKPIEEKKAEVKVEVKEDKPALQEMISKSLFVAQSPKEYVDEHGLIKREGPLERFMESQTIRLTDDPGEKSAKITPDAKPIFGADSKLPANEGTPVHQVFQRNEQASSEQLSTMVGDKEAAKSEPVFEKTKKRTAKKAAVVGE